MLLLQEWQQLCCDCVALQVFTTIFTIEAALKILALGLYKYLEDRWSCFDIIIVLLSLVELGLDGISGLSILRSFRLVSRTRLSYARIPTTY